MSMQRRCDIMRCTDLKWYMILGDFEHAEEIADCSIYGPFETKQQVWKELENHVNPGGASTDDTCTLAPPKKFVQGRTIRLD